MSSVFDNKGAPPSDGDLTKVLGRTKVHWDGLWRHLQGLEGVALEWKFYGAKHGWQAKAQLKKKALAYLIPHEGSFLVGMALGDKAVEALGDSGLPSEVVAEIRAAKRLPEGRPARIEVTSKAKAELALLLLAVKRLS